MPKYRLLTKPELAELEKEFIDYLVLNSITASDWETMKVNDVEGAEKIISLFSDVVFESILRNIGFLEYRAQKAVHVFQCLSDKLVVVSLEASGNEAIDFTDPDFLVQAAHTPPSSLKVFTTDKPFKGNRESELFEMLQTGCVISDNTLFNTLCLMLTHKS